MENISEHYRYIMLYHFYIGFNAAQTARRICKVYGPDTLKERVVQKWFLRFRSGNFCLKGTARSGHPSIVDSPDYCFGRHKSTPDNRREIRKIVGASHGSIVAHLKDAGYVNRADVWVPHLLTDRNL